MKETMLIWRERSSAGHQTEVDVDDMGCWVLPVNQYIVGYGRNCVIFCIKFKRKNVFVSLVSFWRDKRALLYSLRELQVRCNVNNELARKIISSDS